MKTKISVIIPTVNAYEELDLTLTSLAKNSDCAIDYVIVVDPDLSTGKVNNGILQVCKKHAINPWLNTKNLGPYGSWNRGAAVATTDWLIFATDDQYFAQHWDTNLLKYAKPKRLIAGRLVEPGIIPVYKTNIKQDFGISPSEFREKDYNAWVKEQKSSGFTKDGFFIPMLQSRQDFNDLGGYPTDGQFGTSSAKSNDYFYVKNALSRGYEFGTASNSHSYHFQASSWKKKMLKPTIAAVILTKNEQHNLDNCLKSISWVNDIFIIDSGSKDLTLSIAKNYQAKIFNRDFDNFAAQRNFGLSKVAKYNWVLMIDADETCSKELARELQFFAKDIYLDGVQIPRKNYIFGRWVQHTDWYPDLRLIFFRPKTVTYAADVHERAEFISGNGSTVTAQYNLIHHNYDTVEEFVTKNLLRYPREYARVLDARGITFSPAQMITTSLGEFMRRYFLTKGYKDGMYGLILSLLMSAQTLVAYCYLWEIQGKRAELTTEEAKLVFTSLRSKGSELTYWLTTLAIENSRGAIQLFNRVKRKALKTIKGL